MHLRPEECLVGVDVPHAGDPALVEQERLDGRPHAAGERAQRRPGQRAGLQRLQAQARREERVEARTADGELARPRTGADRRTRPRGRRPGRR
jgi:hypothetical protein